MAWIKYRFIVHWTKPIGFSNFNVAHQYKKFNGVHKKVYRPHYY